ncbi:MAG TPA: hypothetical protein ENH82_20070, partial [bacterium]|nr:hypothetical protein [bacterium]
MAVGDEAKTGITGYVVHFTEHTFGSFSQSSHTAGTAVDFINCSFKTEIESRKLDTFGLQRGNLKRVQLNKSVAGTLEHYLHPHDSPVLLAQALGGGITTSSVSGAFIHSISAGAMTGSQGSLGFNVRKGDTSFTYHGGRINSLKISAEVNELVLVSAEFIFKDSSIGATDISSL